MSFNLKFYSKLLITTFFFIVLFFKILAFNKGFVFDDEAWCMFLIKDIPSGSAPTVFFKLLFNFSKGDIYNTRLYFLIFEIISYLIFSYGIYLFFKKDYQIKKNDYIFIFLITFIGFSIFSPPVCYIPNYIGLNKTLIPLIIGLNLIIYSKEFNHYSSLSIMFLSGFLSGFQPFIMITTSSVILLFLVLHYYNISKKEIVKYYFTYLLGIISSFLFYFIFIESFNVFLENEIFKNINHYSKAKVNEPHGILPILRWGGITLQYLLFNILVPALALIYISKLNFNKKLKLLFNILFFFSIVLFSYFEIFKGEHSFASIAPFYILYSFFLIKDIVYFRDINCKTITLIILFVIPILISLGSDVAFKTRATDYVGILFPFLYLKYMKTSNKNKVLALILLSIYIMNYSSMFYRKNWGGFTYSQQNYHLNTLGINQNLMVDQLNFNNIKLLQQKIKKESDIVISNKRLWGYTYLLNAKPLCYNFRATNNQMITNINESNLDEITLFETDYAKFDTDFFKSIKLNTKYKVSKISKLEIFTVYILKK